MDRQLDIHFDDGIEIHGRGTIEVENGRLFADGEQTVEKGDLLYLHLDEGEIRDGDNGMLLDEGEYVICRGGLYAKVDL